MKRLRILIIGTMSYCRAFSGAYSNDLASHRIVGYTAIDPDKDLFGISLVVFTGGEDVNPNIYGEQKHPSTSYNAQRDEVEARVFYRCLELGIPMVGICRGGQFLTAMNGGKLIQDVSNHTVRHPVVGILPPAETGEGVRRWEFEVTSTHHQMMYPFTLEDNEYQILAYSCSISDKYCGVPVEEYKRLSFIDDKGVSKQGTIEPEVIWYKDTNCLAFQYHPEQMSDNTAGRRYFNEAVHAYLNPS